MYKQIVKLSVKEATRKDGGKFLTQTAHINNKWYRVKYTQDCEGSTPKRTGLYDLTINPLKCSVQAGRKRTSKDGHEYTENDTLWVREVVNLRKYTEEEIAKLNAEKMTKIFGGEVNTEDDLPF